MDLVWPGPNAGFHYNGPGPVIRCLGLVTVMGLEFLKVTHCDCRLGCDAWLHSFSYSRKITTKLNLIYPNCPKNNYNQHSKDEREDCNGQSCHWEHVFGKSLLDHEISVHTFQAYTTVNIRRVIIIIKSRKNSSREV
jgi:hypothetical protein